MTSPEIIADLTTKRLYGNPVVVNAARGDIAETIAELALAPDWSLCSGDWG